MTQVIMIFLFFIGLYFYFFVECKTKNAYQKVFDDFQKKNQENRTLSQEEKMKQYEEVLVLNEYTVTKPTPNIIKGEKRIFYMSLLAMGLGIYCVGALIYLAYYFWIQKPHVVIFKV